MVKSSSESGVSRWDATFAQSRPRLIRLAHAQGVPPDAIEDVVQETWFEAWRARDSLRDPAQVVAWLDGIARHVCQRFHRRHGRSEHFEIAGDPDEALQLVVDEQGTDPIETLWQADQQRLLDQALGYLAPEARLLVVGHYLAEIPQRELAQRLGLSLGAVELRLHRTRKQLLRIFATNLAAEARAAGLTLDPDQVTGWRDTRIWCPYCGQRHLEGLFERHTAAQQVLRLRCNACGHTQISSLGYLDLSDQRTFLPAAKRTAKMAGEFYAQSLAQGGWCRCWQCQQPVPLRLVSGEHFAPHGGAQSSLVWQCPCGASQSSAAIVAFGASARVRAFLFQPGRCVIGPEAEITHAGQTVRRFRLLHRDTDRVLDIIADPESLAVRDILEYRA